MAFNDEEIERERRKATSRKPNVDEERLRHKQELRKIFETGSLKDFSDYLEVIGKGAGTVEGDAYIAHFRRVRGF